MLLFSSPLHYLLKLHGNHYPQRHIHPHLYLFVNRITVLRASRLCFWQTFRSLFTPSPRHLLPHGTQRLLRPICCQLIQNLHKRKRLRLLSVHVNYIIHSISLALEDLCEQRYHFKRQSAHGYLKAKSPVSFFEPPTEPCNI